MKENTCYNLEHRHIFLNFSSKGADIQKSEDKRSLEEIAAAIAEEIDNGTYGSDWDSSDEEEDENDEKSNGVKGFNIKMNTNGALFDDGNHSEEAKQESDEPSSLYFPAQSKKRTKAY